jgi:hypothetical protein
MLVSFIIAGVVCGVAALCYSELAAMVPVSGSAYTYTYAVMGELLAWMVGWALVLEYAIAAGAVAVGWSGYFTGCWHISASTCPICLCSGHRRRHDQPACHADRRPCHLAAGNRHQGKRPCQRGAGRDQDPGPDDVHRAGLAGHELRQLRAVRPARVRRCVRRRRLDLLRLRRFRCRLDGRRRDQGSAAEHADRPDRQPRHLHDFTSWLPA